MKSPDEFKLFIGKDIRLEPVLLDQQASIQPIIKLLYMGKRILRIDKEFIIDNLVIEKRFRRRISANLRT